MKLRLAFCLFCGLAGLLAAEGLVRFLLFHPGEWASEKGAGMRKPGLFADPFLEEEYWRLKWRLDPDDRSARFSDSVTGWVDRKLEPETHRYLSPPELGPGQRPLLLYGASYASCVTDKAECFQGLIGSSRLGATHQLWNYGVGGYGIDQVHMLMRETLDRHLADRPVVAIALVADSDFERASLGLRSWPKPRYELVDGELVKLDAPAPTSRELLEAQGTGIRSYAWRGLLHGLRPLPGGWNSRLAGGRAKRVEQRALIEAIVLAIQAELEARELEYFFLICHSPAFIKARPQGRMSLFTAGRGSPAAWILELLDRHGIHYVDSLDSMRSSNLKLHQLYTLKGAGLNHPTEDGNGVLMEALCDGVERYAPMNR